MKKHRACRFLRTTKLTRIVEESTDIPLETLREYLFTMIVKVDPVSKGPGFFGPLEGAILNYRGMDYEET